MSVRYGFDNYKWDQGRRCLLLPKAGEQAQVRLLQEPSEIFTLVRHWVKGYGYINCLGTNCLLCRRSSSRWNSAITPARSHFIVPLIDRTDDKIRAFEGGRPMANKLKIHYKANGSITQGDFVIKCDARKKGKDMYGLISLTSPPVPLTQAEIDRIQELDMNWLTTRGDKSEAEILNIIESL